MDEPPKVYDDQAQQPQNDDTTAIVHSILQKTLLKRVDVRD
jgi:hypothetical protein